MKIAFANNTLQRAATDLTRARRSWSTQGVADSYQLRIQLLQQIATIDELYQVRAVRFHALRGDRQGQYAVTLIGPWRLIFEYDEGKDEIIVVEVTDYHD